MPRPRKGEAPVKGKKSIPWHEDPEILSRLTLVQSMMVQKARAWQIAEALGYTVRTALRDMDRVRDIQRREAIGDIVERRNESLAQLDEIIRQAHAQIRGSTDAKIKLDAMRIILQAQKQRDEILGTKAPDMVNHSGNLAVTFDAKGMSDDELAAIAAGRS